MNRWFDPRAAALAGLIAFLAALPALTWSRQSREYFLFKVTLTSDTAGMTQLFWDAGRGMNEEDSSAQPLKVEPRPAQYGFLLPIGTIRALRFDVINRPASLTFRDARIEDRYGTVLRTFGVGDFVAANQIARHEVRGDTLAITTVPSANDPFLELTLKTPLVLQAGPLLRLRDSLTTLAAVFLLGLVLGAPATVRRLRPGWERLSAWVQARPGSAVLLAATLAVMVQAHPVVFLGRSFVSPNNGSLMLYGDLPTLPGGNASLYADGMGSDVGALLFQHLYYPMAQRDALARGEWPLWNRYSLAGEPLLGQGQSMFGDPLNFLTILADGRAWAWDLRFLLAHWLLSAGLGLTVWRLTRHAWSALLVAASSAFIGFYLFRINHPATFSVGYAHWLLWAWAGLRESADRRAEVKWLGALLLAHLLVFTSGTMKEAAMLIACLDLAGVALVLVAPGTFGRRLRLLGLAALAGLGLGLATAPLWVTFLTTWAHSYTGYDQPGAVTLPFSRLLGFLDDLFYRQNGGDERVVAPALNVFLGLGLLWALAGRDFWRGSRDGLALAAAALVPLAFAFGLIPVAVILRVPLVRNIINVGNVFSCPLLILAAVLAGFGFRSFLTAPVDRSWWRRGLATGLLAAALAAAWTVSMWSVPKSAFFAGYAGALAGTALLLPAAAWLGRREERAHLAVLAVAAALPLLHWRFVQYRLSRFNHYAYTPGRRADFFAPSPAAGLVDRAKTEPARVIGWERGLFPSYNTALRWESLYGVDALRSAHYQQLSVALGLERVWMWDNPTPESAIAKLQRGHDLLNVRFHLLDPGSRNRSVPGLTLLGDADLDVYESPTAWPRAFFTNRAAPYATMEEFAAYVRNTDGRPFAAVETGTPLSGVPPSLDGRTVRPATGYRLTPNTTEFILEADGPGLAVLTETYYEADFRATLDGKPVPYFRVNHAFKGVRIETGGRHTVRFEYRPEHFTLSLWLGAAGLAGLAGGAGFWWRRAR